MQSWFSLSLQKWQRRFFLLYEHGLLRYALDDMVSMSEVLLSPSFDFFAWLKVNQDCHWVTFRKTTGAWRALLTHFNSHSLLSLYMCVCCHVLCVICGRHCIDRPSGCLFKCLTLILCIYSCILGMYIVHKSLWFWVFGMRCNSDSGLLDTIVSLFVKNDLHIF